MATFAQKSWPLPPPRTMRVIRVYQGWAFPLLLWPTLVRMTRTLLLTLLRWTLFLLMVFLVTMAATSLLLLTLSTTSPSSLPLLR